MFEKKQTELSDIIPETQAIDDKFNIEFHINTAIRSFLTATTEGLRIGDINGGERISIEAVESLESILYGAGIIASTDEKYKEYRDEIISVAKRMYNLNILNEDGTEKELNEEDKRKYTRAKLAVCIRSIYRISSIMPISVKL